ncbi:MAG TPA: hypothetical protein VFK74_02875 [Azospira sp.]|nr:hypothetical protein [Azospira sp.]
MEETVRQLLQGFGFSIANMSYRLSESGAVYEYRMIIKTYGKHTFERLAEHLRRGNGLLEFRISPTGD